MIFGLTFPAKHLQPIIATNYDAGEKNYRVVMMKYPLKVWKNTEMAATPKALSTKLGIDSPILVGVSDGGVLAQLYAKLYMAGGLIMVSALTVDSTYFESMKKEKLYMPLMKVYLRQHRTKTIYWILHVSCLHISSLAQKIT